MDKNYFLHKYLNGEATPEEIVQLKDDPEFFDFLKIAEQANNFETPRFNETKTFQQIISKKEGKVIKLVSYKSVYKVVAVAAVLILSLFLILPSSSKIETKIAENKTITLPDNSNVILNAVSSITYKEKKWDDNRTLKLEGEAFFKVAKGKKFDVQTSQGIVSVLGTQFNVYSRNNHFKITCYEGLVQVSYQEESIKLSEGEEIWIKNGTLFQENKILITQPTWTNGESSFNEESLENVIDELERQYTIQVNLKTTTSKKFTGSFTHKNLEIALLSICEPMGYKFSIKDTNVIIDAN